MKKKLFALMMCLTLTAGMFFGTGGGNDAAAAESRASVMESGADSICGSFRQDGLIPLRFSVLSGEYPVATGTDSQDENRQTGGLMFKSSQAYDRKWGEYSTYYFYNKLSVRERTLYDALDKVCQKMLAKNTPARYDKLNDVYMTEPVSVADFAAGKDLTDSAVMKEVVEKMIDVCMIFRCSNPQYYFLSSQVLGVNFGKGEPGLSFGCYRAFAGADKRKAATSRMQKQLTAWNREIKAVSGEFNKVRYIHDLINDKVTYDMNMDGGGGLSGSEVISYDENAFTQSVYSVLCMDKTVCAGYSQTFTMLCNGAGIDAVAVTSAGHEWNKVRINDSWYNVDLTWEDQLSEEMGTGVYVFLARSDKVLDDMDIRYCSAAPYPHQEESCWKGRLPVCSLDAGPKQDTPTEPGSLPQPAGKVSTPKISLSGGKVTITCATPGAEIYYTTDKGKPVPASAKSSIYKKPFTFKKGMKIRAVAVKDTCRDSAVASAVYHITYKLKGGKNNSKNPDSCYRGNARKLYNPTRKGYQFAGWYTDKACTKKITKLSENQKKDITLYAKWKPVKYKVVFKGNKSTSGRMTALTSRKYGKAFQLPGNKFRRSGYKFTGWNTKANGKGKKYKNKQAVKNLTVKSGGKVVLYAQWKKKTSNTPQ